MDVIPLQSGSNGNCYHVATASTRLLIDAGISPRQTVQRLRANGLEITDVDAILVTHDHSDHCRYLAQIANRFQIPVHLTDQTLAALSDDARWALNDLVNCFRSGESFEVGELKVHTIPTPHDAVDGVAYILESDCHRLGIWTDLGHAFDELRELLGSLDAVVLESNYDEELLLRSRYPAFLKKRIRGDGGHLSNEEAAFLLSQHGGPHLQWACLCHLSGENNSPQAALQTHRFWVGNELPLYVADRYAASEAMTIAPKWIAGVNKIGPPEK